jgi:hypothetical protein
VKSISDIGAPVMEFRRLWRARLLFSCAGVYRPARMPDAFASA